MPTLKDETIAWVLWHIARIEDLIMGILVADDMKRKVYLSGLEAIRQAGGVTNKENSMWLLDFWRKKDVTIAPSLLVCFGII